LPDTGGVTQDPEDALAPRLAALFASRSSWFDLGVFAVGFLMVAYYSQMLVRTGTTTSWLYVLAIPLVAVIARFPVVLDRRDGSIEVGFESARCPRRRRWSCGRSACWSAR
jgi:hypothetical protein